MSDRILLRTLTEKSRIGIDEYTSKFTVGELMEFNPGKLVYVYYYYEHITFTDEILDKLNIYERHRIEKPGYDHYMLYRRKMDYAMGNIRNGGKKGYAILNKERKHQRQKAAIASSIEKMLTSKSYLQGKNHGR